MRAPPCCAHLLALAASRDNARRDKPLRRECVRARPPPQPAQRPDPAPPAPDPSAARLYFDAEVEEDMAGPMASSLAVVELLPVHGASSAAPSPAGCTRDPKPLDAAWARAADAWYPDAAYVCCGQPGHYMVRDGVWRGAGTAVGFRGTGHCTSSFCAATRAARPLRRGAGVRRQSRTVHPAGMGEGWGPLWRAHAIHAAATLVTMQPGAHNPGAQVRRAPLRPRKHAACPSQPSPCPLTDTPTRPPNSGLPRVVRGKG